MKLIIAGSRHLSSKHLMDRIALTIIDRGWDVSEVVSGGCRGVDRLGEEVAKGFGCPVRRFLPDWSKGKKAGPLRNQEMAEYADALLTVWDGKSPGTKDMIEKMRAAGKAVYEVRIDK